MNGFQLFHGDGRATGIWACGACRIVHRTEDGAAHCCEPYLCKQCRVALPKSRVGLCDGCSRAKSEAEASQRWANAKMLPAAEYDSMVYDDTRDKYYSTPGEALESIFDDYDEIPDEQPRLYRCTPRRLSLDAAEIVHWAIERDDHHEDASDEIGNESVIELQALLNAWCAEHGCTSYFPDYSVGIDVSSAFEAMRREAEEDLSR